MARGTRTKADFIEAASGIVGAEGWAGLSAKSLSVKMGTHSTAVYRHFSSWNDLVVAVFDLGFGQLMRSAVADAELLTSPRARMRSVLSVLRAGLDADPNIADGIYSILSADEAVPTPNVDEFGVWVADQLIEMGVPVERIPVLYQAIESIAIGFTLADYTGHPHHVSNRRQRRRRQATSVFEAMSRSDDSMRTVMDEAFELSVNLILDECERVAKQDPVR